MPTVQFEWVVVALLVLVLGYLLVSQLRGRGTTPALPYEREAALLSTAERYFYYALCDAVDGEQHIFSKVRLIDVVKVRPGTPNAQTHRNRIKSKHVDFVLCERKTFAPLLVIELDDASHNSSRQRERDALKDSILGAAGLPILRVKASNAYNRKELAERIQDNLKPAP